MNNEQEKSQNSTNTRTLKHAGALKHIRGIYMPVICGQTVYTQLKLRGVSEETLEEEQEEKQEEKIRRRTRRKKREKNE